MRNSRPAIQVTLALALAIFATSAKAEKAPRIEVRYASAFQEQLKLDGTPATVLKVEDKPHELDIWKKFFASSFPNGFRYDRGVRVILNDVQRGGRVALFIFSTPKPAGELARSFEQMRIAGTLISKVQTYYVAVADQQVFGLFLTEQDRLPVDSKLVGSWANMMYLEAHRTNARAR